MFESYFSNPQPVGLPILNSTDGPVYAVLYKDTQIKPKPPMKSSKLLCTPTNRCEREGKTKRLDRQSTIENISIALYTLALMEANHNIALRFRDHFKENIEAPLLPLSEALQRLL